MLGTRYIEKNKDKIFNKKGECEGCDRITIVNPDWQSGGGVKILCKNCLGHPENWKIKDEILTTTTSEFIE